MVQKASRTISVLLLAVLALSGCANGARPANVDAPRLVQATSAGEDESIVEPTKSSAVPQASETCLVTPPSDERPPIEHVASWSRGEWYHSPDRKIWIAYDNIAGHAAGGPGKVLWGKPEGAELTVTGRRLDGEAPPLDVDVSPYYKDQYLNPSGIGFPTAGCWEIEARADSSVLRIVVEVYPRFYGPDIGRCADLADVAENSNAIVVAEMEGNAPDRPDFVWQTMRVKQVWKEPVALAGWQPVTVGQRLDILRNTRYEHATLLQPGRTYLLFLQSRPGFPWRIFCSHWTLAEVLEEQVVGVGWNPKIEPLWTENTLAAIEQEVKALLASR